MQNSSKGMILMEKEKSMTIQRAAHFLLTEAGEPIKSTKLAKMAIEKGLVAKSNAKNPIQSLSQTIERNIRSNSGNNPKLVFIQKKDGRYIGTEEMVSKYADNISEDTKPPGTLIKLYLPDNLKQNVRVYALAEEISAIDETIMALIKEGIDATHDRSIEKLRSLKIK